MTPVRFGISAAGIVLQDMIKNYDCNTEYSHSCAHCKCKHYKEKARGGKICQ